MKTKKIPALLALSLGLVLIGVGVGMGMHMRRARYTQGRIKTGTGPCILLDAGHGGFDPGALSNSKTHEDDINLSITMMVKAELESRGYEVLLTREDAQALGSDKQADMRKRREIIANSSADYAISIHLNASTDASCRGPVVLYHPTSERGGEIARTLQKTLNEQLQPPRAREVQTGQYYILKSGPMPIVIVECGFLTNAQEEKLLMQQEYQQRVAAAIAQGMDTYIKEKGTGSAQQTPQPATPQAGGADAQGIDTEDETQ